MSNSQALIGNLQRGLAFILSAPAGTGKTTLVYRLLAEFPSVKLNISYTTRKPRPGEVNGQDYHFISKEAFQKKIEENDFLEWAEVFGNYYGTSKEALMSDLKKGHHVMLVIDTQGAKKVMDTHFPVTSIFLSPPSFEELRRRLVARGTDSQEAIDQRLAWSKKELDLSHLYDYHIVNQDLNIAYEVLRCILIAEEHRNVGKKTCLQQKI